MGMFHLQDDATPHHEMMAFPEGEMNVYDLPEVVLGAEPPAPGDGDLFAKARSTLNMSPLRMPQQLSFVPGHNRRESSSSSTSWLDTSKLGEGQTTPISAHLNPPPLFEKYSAAPLNPQNHFRNDMLTDELLNDLKRQDDADSALAACYLQINAPCHEVWPLSLVHMVACRIVSVHISQSLFNIIIIAILMNTIIIPNTVLLKGSIALYYIVTNR